MMNDVVLSVASNTTTAPSALVLLLQKLANVPDPDGFII